MVGDIILSDCGKDFVLPVVLLRYLFAHTATLSRSCIGSLQIQPVLVFRATVTEGSGSVWVVSLDVAQN
jgi:hypothetical protein